MVGEHFTAQDWADANRTIRIAVKTQMAMHDMDTYELARRMGKPYAYVNDRLRTVWVSAKGSTQPPFKASDIQAMRSIFGVPADVFYAPTEVRVIPDSPRLSRDNLRREEQDGQWYEHLDLPDDFEVES